MTGQAANPAALPLLIQRIALAAFFGVWVLDKFINPEHTAGVFKGFYGIELDLNMASIVGAVQAVILIAFLLGFLKTYSYILMFAMHAVSTLSTFKFLINPYGEGPGMLFWAAVPVLAAFWLQFALRKSDTYSLDDMRGSSSSVDQA